LKSLKFIIFFSFCFFCLTSFAQLKWVNVDSLYQPLPASVHVFKTTDLLDGNPNIAYYFVADLKNRKLDFTVDTTCQRRLTPSKFFEKDNNPLLVVNCTFFSFESNRNLNLVIKEGKVLSHNSKPTKGKGADSARLYYPNTGGIGITKRRKADVAWIRADSVKKFADAFQEPLFGISYATNRRTGESRSYNNFSPWRVYTAIGGGPVLLQKGEIKITNEEEMMFTGKAINDKHPRTAMGYTKNDRLIILVVQGRFPGLAEGATLTQEAQILKDLGCWEALNLDGGGSSCMLVNGKETIKVSDAAGQRPVPAVFIIKRK
jgi:exopolysaccharide biosynthesis protein